MLHFNRVAELVKLDGRASTGLEQSCMPAINAASQGKALSGAGGSESRNGLETNAQAAVLAATGRHTQRALKSLELEIKVKGEGFHSKSTSGGPRSQAEPWAARTSVSKSKNREGKPLSSKHNKIAPVAVQIAEGHRQQRELGEVVQHQKNPKEAFLQNTHQSRSR